MIHRRQFNALLLATPFATAGCSAASSLQSEPIHGGFSYLPGITTRDRLVAPDGRAIKAAFAINPGVQVIDVAGPWEAIQDTYSLGEDVGFELFTVSETTKPVRASGGLKIVSD